tara:strand:+ start:149 stop:1552 length:1404 start_codon:yes stop_codon:yes gene_type:complete
MSLTIDNSNDSELKDTFNLDVASVSNATVEPKDDASVILRTFVLKMLQKQMKSSGRFTPDTVKRDFRILMSLTDSDFKTEEDFQKYEEYMGKLVKKALALPVYETVNQIDDNLPGKKGSAMFELFGSGAKERSDFNSDEAYEKYLESVKNKPSPVAKVIKDKEVTFEQLLLPAYLGQTYEGTAKNGKMSKVMETIDKDQSLFDASEVKKHLTVDKSDENTKGRISYTWDLESYLKSLLKDDGFDDFDSEHLRFIPKNEKAETVTLNKTRFDRLLGMSSNKIEIGRGYVKEMEDVVPTVYKIGDNEFDAKTQKGRDKAASFLTSMIRLEDSQVDKVAKEILEKSNFMKARRVRDRDKAMRGVGEGKEPTLSELTRNYLDLDVGKVTFVISVFGYQSLKKGTISQPDLKEGELEKREITVYGLVLDKTGELRLAEEGAFAITEKDKAQSISDIVKGVKTFMAKTRRFRS